jgi:uncharacterized membrane protein (UPF0127 family)
MKLPKWLILSSKAGSAIHSLSHSNSRMQILNRTRNTELANKAEVAGSGAKRTKGLLGRKGLAPGEGMWIVPCEAVHTFGMQFPIDLVYIDRKYRVKKVKNAVSPWRISACFTAHSILELPVGAIRDSQTSPGDLLELIPVESETTLD